MTNFVICSEDAENPYNATYEFELDLEGDYQLNAQSYFQFDYDYWCTNSNNLLYVYPPEGSEHTPKYIEFPAISSNLTSDILQWFRTAFDQINDWGITTRYEYNPYQGTYIMHFYNTENEITFLAFNVQLPAEDAEGKSTISDLFSWTPNGSNMVGYNPEEPYKSHYTDLFIVYDTKFGAPRNLEFYCEEMDAENYTLDGTKPILYFPANNEILPQTVRIKEKTKTLNVSIHKRNQDSNYNFKGSYRLYFTRK